ncbi:hypothetical protein C2845_PMPSC002132 [Panicum miliaceum]|uniref:DUF6598 domain-containing protein n=1 Tax=Panicum miliaceum TaxID=4540 RepID=A0A3L6P9H2_PANMI|nr:hypothetical protein C2845_PMPSC002132 [Panicum miliaceum]
MDVWLVIFERNMDDVEASYAKKLKLMEAGAQLAQLGMDGVLLDFFKESFPDYYLSRKKLRLRYPKLVFGDITHILAMEYTDEGVPRYVLEGSCNSLQVYSARVSGIGTGALSVFGVVAVRDSIDPKRNPIFNRHRSDCQIITEENPYLVLTGPGRAVVMNESVIIEAELKVKGPDEDTYAFAGKIKKITAWFQGDYVRRPMWYDTEF